MSEQALPQAWDEEVDLRRLVETLLRWKWVIIGVTLLAGISTFIISGFLPKTYESSTTLSIVMQTVQISGGVKSLPGMTVVPDFELSPSLISDIAFSDPVLKELVEKTDIAVPSLESLKKSLSITFVEEGQVVRLSARGPSAEEAKILVDEWAYLVSKEIRSLLSRSYFTALREILAPQAENYFQELRKAEKAWQEFSASNPIPILETQSVELSQKIAEGETQLLSINNQIAVTNALLDSTMHLLRQRIRETDAALSAQLQLTLTDFQRSQKDLQEFDRKHNLNLLKAEIDQLQARLVDLENRFSEIPGLLEIAQKKLIATEEELKHQESFITLQQVISQNPILMNVVQSEATNELSKVLGLSLSSQVINPVYTSLVSERALRRLEIQELQKRAEVLKNDIATVSQKLQEAREQYLNLASQRELLAQEVSSKREAYFLALEQKGRLIPFVSADGINTLFIGGEAGFPELLRLLERRMQLLVDLDTYRIQQNALKSSLVEYRQKLEEVQRRLAEAQGQRDKLLRDLQILRDSYAYYQQAVNLLRFIDNLEKNESFWQSNIHVVSPGTLPSRPLSPRKALNAAVATVAALFVSTLAVFFLEFWHQSAPRAKA